MAAIDQVVGLGEWFAAQGGVPMHGEQVAQVRAIAKAAAAEYAEKGVTFIAYAPGNATEYRLALVDLAAPVPGSAWTIGRGWGGDTVVALLNWGRAQALDLTYGFDQFAAEKYLGLRPGDAYPVCVLLTFFGEEIARAAAPG